MYVIDETEDDLHRLVAADFATGTDTMRSRKLFIDWLHYRARAIPPLPRKVIISREILNLSNQYPAISLIKYAFENGVELTPWLSNSVKTRKSDHKADMMFNDWQITHFHLGNILKSPSEANRTTQLLFAHITSRTATFIDVRPHGSWANFDLLEILLRTNPSALEACEIKAIKARQYTEEEYYTIRMKGLTAFVVIAGRSFSPAMGIMSSGHAMRIVVYADTFMRIKDKLMLDLSANDIPKHLKTPIFSRLGVPIRLGIRFSRGALALIDKNRRNLILYQMKPLE